MITLKPNTYYKTRDGRKAFIGFKLPPTSAKEHKDDWCGYIIPHPESWAFYWFDNGRFDPSEESELDLIAEWAEPKLRPWKIEEVPDCWIRAKAGSYRTRIIGGNTSYITVIGITDTVMNICFDALLGLYEHSTDNGKTWLPCGVME